MPFEFRPDQCNQIR